MDAAELNEVCRLCPSSGGGEELMYVFDERLSVKNNMKEVILVTTGVEVQDTDLISKKICHRCCTKTLQMFLFRQDALTQDRALREKCSRFLEDKGIRLPNTCITIKRERRESVVPLKRHKEEPNDIPLKTTKPKKRKTIHPSVIDIYKTYPHIKLPKKCLGRHLTPVVSFPMGAVEKYFKKHRLDMREFIYKPDTKRTPFKAVAKKRTSFPTKRKTVSPIKICKKVLENSESSNINYVCTPVPREKKKSVSSPNTEKCLPSTIPHESKTAQSTSSAKLIETSPPSKVVNEKPPETPILQPAIHMPQPVETVKTITPAVIGPVPEDTRDSCLSGTSKPEFIESLGLTPTVTATKSQTQHVCNLCGSVHNNAFKLKTHMRKHMVCQFCKLRFKTLETKQDHVDNLCQVKEIRNSPGPLVELEKIHLNLAVRRKFKAAFSDFEAIPGLTELDSTEQVSVKVDAPLPRLESERVVLLSDDEQNQTKPSDLPETASSDKLEAGVDNVVVRPDVRIKNNTTVDNIVGNMHDKQLVKELLSLLKPRRSKTIEKVLQTDFPATKDIKINNAEGFCEFKNLKHQLLSYQIPVSITNGPFHVAYQYKSDSNSTKSMVLWKDLPVIDDYKKSSNHATTSANFSTDKDTATHYQIQSTSVSSSVMPTGTYPEQASRNNFPASSSIGSTLTNHAVETNTSKSAAPSLQNFAQNTTSMDNKKSIPIPKISVTAARGYAANTARRNLSLGKNISYRSPSSSTISRKSLPANISNRTNRINSSVVMNGSSSSVTDIGASSSSASSSSASRVQVTNSTSFQADASSVSEASKFRVRNVWELQ